SYLGPVSGGPIRFGTQKKVSGIDTTEKETATAMKEYLLSLHVAVIDLGALLGCTLLNAVGLKGGDDRKKQHHAVTGPQHITLAGPIHRPPHALNTPER